MLLKLSSLKPVGFVHFLFSMHFILTTVNFLAYYSHLPIETIFILPIKMTFMKRILLGLSVAATTFVACNNNPQVGADNMRQGVTIIADTNGLSEFQQWKKMEAEKSIASYAVAQRATSPKRVVARKATPVYKNETATTETAYPAKPAKKGWSKAAKGAAIGGVTGAAAGAIINKRNRVVGGVIGGAVGAGVGYGIGRHMDKKDGRY